MLNNTLLSSVTVKLPPSIFPNCGKIAFLRPRNVQFRLRIYHTLKPFNIACKKGTPNLSYRYLHIDRKNVAHNSKKTISYLNIPNLLTVSRIVCAPLIGYNLIHEQLVSALYLFCYSCVTDLLDGQLARKFNLQTPLGSVLDPAADKLLMLVTTIALTIPSGPCLIPLPIATVILGRDLVLAGNSFYHRYKSMQRAYAGGFSTKQFFDIFSYPSIVVQPTTISKWNTFFQMIYLGTGIVILTLQYSLGKDDEEDESKPNNKKKLLQWAHNFMYIGGYAIIVTGLWSGASYFVGIKNTMKYLK
ncbi:hypothetical protein TBLA_0E02000 [Henningerozyma blattae CBS 6284]|uniref:CDP-diacylglycerol--glycerol-3-phosphate 3-phosphatidyltransferase n=1 Tax=Henningerozyma blattae (strain ATCC 34711 / CBS 6284 / DSM 70876 / NBRC 10599 / NRRL Y-10934 / UCD 77-7) TaxID=1071380 RepID=I2H4F1_HENB6|nr:hypothetical protein TBLA_0E02000 [Tetrapisispora blattae CBS 6284]CCH61253.1 hypothetical protein TBLA_0E02000 [Tetrapisispora blattae CBS 6284]